MLSYSLGSIKVEKYDIDDDLAGDNLMPAIVNQRRNGFFGFIKNREISVAKELEKYGQIRGDLLKRLTDVLAKNNFNVKMLVAADHWYRGNDKPRKFTPEMFTTSNIHFLNISAMSYGNKRVWDRDSLSKLLTYSKYLRDYVYPESQDIHVVDIVADADDIFDQFDFGEHNDDYDGYD